MTSKILCCRQHIVVTIYSVQGDCCQAHFLLEKRTNMEQLWNSVTPMQSRCVTGRNPQRSRIADERRSFLRLSPFGPFCLSHSFIQKLNWVYTKSSGDAERKRLCLWDPGCPKKKKFSGNEILQTPWGCFLSMSSFFPQFSVPDMKKSHQLGRIVFHSFLVSTGRNIRNQMSCLLKPITS